MQSRFPGNLYVLVNGGSFSNTGIVSACLERDRRAVFIGEETGGNKYEISGNPTEVTMPGTGIRCYISTTNFRIQPGVNRGHGIVPAYPVKPDIEDLLLHKDPAMALALKLVIKP